MSFKLHLQALRDMLSRYRAVFAHAWARRKDTDSKFRLPHESEFLPAALALQETPVSAAPRITMWLIGGFALIALLWAIFGKIDIVAVAVGKIVSGDRTKTIQPLESATVKAIFVKDGQSVKAGDVLVDLDATMAEADSRRLQNDWATSVLQQRRGKSLLIAIDSHQPPVLERSRDIDDNMWRDADQLLKSQHDEFAAKLARIDADIKRGEAERISTQTLVRKLEQTLPLAQAREKDLQEMMKQGFASRHNYLDQERIRIEQENDLATQRSRLVEVDSALISTRGQRDSLIAETRRVAMDSIADGTQKAETARQELVKTHTRSRQARLTAPVDGTVQQLAIHTVGGVVTPAQVLMMIVPKDQPLEVEAFLENKDIGFVRDGQTAEIKVETFPYTKYGTIAGNVLTVSDDAINDEKKGLIYATRVSMMRSIMSVEGKTVNLSPGMSVSVEIKTGKRRIIEYFLSPLLQYSHESLHER